jgi:membrane protease YdiL (CAAX protease family)
MSTDIRMFHGHARGVTAFPIACVAVAALVLSHVIDAYVMHDLLRGSSFPAGRLIAATALGGALVSIPALRRMCGELFDAPFPATRGVEASAIALLLAAMVFAVIGMLALSEWAWGGEPALARRMGEPLATLQRWAPAISLAPAAHGEVAAVLLVTVIEDIVILGLLYPAWALQWGWARSAFAASVIAASAHPDMLTEFVTMLVLVALLRRTGSLRACIAVHTIASAATCFAVLGRFVMPANRITGEIELWRLHLACLLCGAIAATAYLRTACDEDTLDSLEAFPQR